MTDSVILKIRARKDELLAWVTEIETRLDKESPLDISAAPETQDFAKGLYGSLGDFPSVTRALIRNVEKMRGVKRKDNMPYALHPLRASLILNELAPDRVDPEISIVNLLLHDYVEEGDGKNAEAVAGLRKDMLVEEAEFGTIRDYGRNSLLLTEPLLELGKLPVGFRIRHFINPAFLVQLQEENQSSLFDAVLGDKLDNINDLGYLHNTTKSPPEIRESLSRSLAYYKFIVDNIDEQSSPVLARALKDCIASTLKREGIPEDHMLAHIKKYQKILNFRRDYLRKEIVKYHSQAGL